MAVRIKPNVSPLPPNSGGHAKQNHLCMVALHSPERAALPPPAVCDTHLCFHSETAKVGLKGLRPFHSTTRKKKKKKSFQHYSTQRYPNPLFFPYIFLLDMTYFAEEQHFQYKLIGTDFFFPKSRMFVFTLSLLCALILPLHIHNHRLPSHFKVSWKHLRVWEHYDVPKPV